jgi:hypothetical protein
MYHIVDGPQSCDSSGLNRLCIQDREQLRQSIHAHRLPTIPVSTISYRRAEKNMTRKRSTPLPRIKEARGCDWSEGEGSRELGIPAWLPLSVKFLLHRIPHYLSEVSAEYRFFPPILKTALTRQVMSGGLVDDIYLIL